MFRYLLALFVIACCSSSLAHAELKVGVGKAIITPDPLLPVSGGVGPGRPATGKQGELTARAMVFQQGETKVAIVQLDLLGFPSVLCARIHKQVPRIPADNILIGSTHTHSAPDCYGFPGLNGKASGNLEVHGLRLQSSGRRRQSGARQPATRPSEDRHRRSQGQDRLQLLRSGTLRSAHERDSGDHARRQDDRHAGQLRHSSRSAGQRRRTGQPRSRRPAVRSTRSRSRRHGHVHERRARRHDHGRQSPSRPTLRPDQGQMARLAHLGRMRPHRPAHGLRSPAHRQGRRAANRPGSCLLCPRRSSFPSSPS